MKVNYGIAIQSMINHTNERIVGWYKNALLDHGVKGAGKAHFDKANNKVVVEYIEDGVQRNWSMVYYPEYIIEQDLDWVYNCWSEGFNMSLG